MLPRSWLIADSPITSHWSGMPRCFDAACRLMVFSIDCVRPMPPPLPLITDVTGHFTGRIDVAAAVLCRVAMRPRVIVCQRSAADILCCRLSSLTSYYTATRACCYKAPGCQIRRQLFLRRFSVSLMPPVLRHAV